ncbi:MAG: type IV pilus assembly protein PilM [bacterium]
MPNPLQNMFGSIFKKAEGSVLGVDLGSSSIKLVQLKRKKGRAILETYGEIALGPYNNTEVGRATNLTIEKLSVALKDLVKEANVTTNSCGLSIPISSSLIAFIKMPDVDDRQLEQMIPLEARKYIPVAASEVTINHWIIPKDESAFSEYQNVEEKPTENSKDVVLVVVHNDAANKNTQIVKQAGLASSFSEIELFGSIRSVTEQSLSPQMIMDFGAGTAKIYIVERGILRASHVINRGGQDITLAISRSLSISFDEAEKVKKDNGLIGNINGVALKDIVGVHTDYIFSEARRVVANYQQKYNKNIGKVYMIGGGANLKGLTEETELNLQLPISLGHPFGKVEYPAFLENVLRDISPEFSVAVGLALRKLQESE